MSHKKLIPVAEPALVGNEKKYVLDCLDSNWISSNGKYIEKFESGFAEFCSVKHALSCSNGTVALHIALLGLGIQPGDEVIVPTLTYVATANAVVYCGGKPVFVDSDPLTWNMDPAKIEGAITARTKAIIVVHLYGCPANMDAIMKIASDRKLAVIEDAAEAHGAKYNGKRVGSFGLISTFSFYGNKIITTGEGGMVTTQDDGLALKMRQVKGQGMDLSRRYWFPMIGYNYRMTNIEAAIGLAQLEKIEWHIQRRSEVAARYKKNLSSDPSIKFQAEPEHSENVYWMTSIVLDEKAKISRDQLMEELSKQGIETRPFFYPIHTLPMYQETVMNQSFPIADSLSARGMNLPSSALLQDDDIDHVCEQLLKALK
jgi:perosamine synthetase